MRGRAPTDRELAEAREGFEIAADAVVEPLGDGLIHHTFHMRVAEREAEYVLQRVNPIFAPTVHRNIEAVTEHLDHHGIRTPRLLPSAQQRPWLDLGAGGVWRLMTYIDGSVLSAIEHPQQARSAGALVGRVHRCLDSLSHAFVKARPPGHARERHVRALVEAVEHHREHRLHRQVEELARELLALTEAVTPLSEAPDRLGHGDLKLSNVLFSPDRSQAECLIDLDTVGPLVLALEWGDAWRSWCSFAPEDEPNPVFQLEVFAASWEGYVDGLGNEPARETREAMLRAPEWIALELAIRFAADSLAETYFGWDRSRYDSAGDHNLARARGQRALAEAVARTRAERATILGV